jgi:hypothetical protein
MVMVVAKAEVMVVRRAAVMGTERPAAAGDMTAARSAVRSPSESGRRRERESKTTHDDQKAHGGSHLHDAAHVRAWTPGTRWICRSRTCPRHIRWLDPGNPLRDLLPSPTVTIVEVRDNPEDSARTPARRAVRTHGGRPGPAIER